MSEHTPGPWGIDRDDRGVIDSIGPVTWWAKYAADGGLDASDADARLIAAAPELLEALLYIVNDTPTPGGDAELTAEGYNRACAVIAKAEGREGLDDE